MNNQNLGSSTSIEATKIKTLYAIIAHVLIDNPDKLTAQENQFLDEFENGKCWVGYDKSSLATFADCNIWMSMNSAEKAAENFEERMKSLYPNLLISAQADDFVLKESTSHFGYGMVAI